MNYTAAIITVSDKEAPELQEKGSSPFIAAELQARGWKVIHEGTVPGDRKAIQDELIRCVDSLDAYLVITTGGTGFSERDVAPEATAAAVDRRVPGIPEAMRAESVRITERGMLSRQEAGIRGRSLIVNLPGSKKAALECLGAVVGAIRYGVDMLRGAKQ